MRIVRFQREPTDPPSWGWVKEDRIGVIEESPFEPFRRQEALLLMDKVRLLAPVTPGKIVCVGWNYLVHADELNAEVPKVPLLFLKPPSSVIGPGQAIRLPPQSNQVEHEGELVVIIGRQGRWVSPDESTQLILGYSIANDVTARDLQRSDDQWTRAKGFDTFCPLGPWIETELDTSDTLVKCSVNGQLRQMASTRDMIFPVRELIAFISSIMTLEPGDIILTGTPAGVGKLNPGDEVTVEIEGIGSLTNPVREDAHSK
ncbi:MAG: 2-hydroxyhepta-2,4-diene-1,7-dioate isomerase [Chloroflexi bacterium RBG_16_48_8]|nr:MAG: 2-hydroxyhepta-2,4-diene-1,7-dioate isomerase [Chloroflexi bacterium RBG_16_48_8]